MTDELDAAIRTLQGDDATLAPQAFAAMVEMAGRDPLECAAALARTVLAEQIAGGFRTARLLTLLGLTRVSVPDCVPLCVDIVRIATTGATSLPSDAILGAAAVIACTEPRELLPDLASLMSAGDAADATERARGIAVLLEITSQWLRQAPDTPYADMSRWLWRDCATIDMMTVVDFVGMHIARTGVDDPVVALMVDLIERIPATADQKNYAASRLQESGVDEAVLHRLQIAVRAARVAPDVATDGTTLADPEPPAPEPRVDECLAAFSEANDFGIEAARAEIDAMFEELNPPPALSWWVAVTVDTLPAARRKADIDWALLRLVTLSRQQKKTIAPPSILQRWLETPQLLTPNASMAALHLLAQQQPGALVRRWLYRAVAATPDEHSRIVMGDMWQNLAAAEPLGILLVASRWIAFGYTQTDFLELLLETLLEVLRRQPATIATLSDALASNEGLPADVVQPAQLLLDALRNSP